MTVTNADVHPMEDPHGHLELALIEEFLLAHGYAPRELNRLPDDQRRHLLEGASIYAAGKLAEIQARAHYVHDLRHHE